VRRVRGSGRLPAALAVACLLALAAAPAPALAQTREDLVCGWPADRADAFYPDRLKAELDLNALANEGRYEAAYTALRDRFEAWADTHGRLEDPAVSPFLAGLGRFLGGDFTYKPVIDPTPRGYFVEWGHGDRIQIACDADTREQAKNIAYTAFAWQVLYTHQHAADAEARAAFIRKRADQYHDLLANGLPMWPWEALVNGWFLGPGDAAAPPGNQLVLLRPSGGLEADTAGQREARVRPALALEPLGFAHYTAGDFTRWWGLSLLVTLRSDMGAGFGGLARYNQWTLGATWHNEHDLRDDDLFVFIGVDLYDYLKKRGDDSGGYLGRARDVLVERYGAPLGGL